MKKIFHLFGVLSFLTVGMFLFSGNVSANELVADSPSQVATDQVILTSEPRVVADEPLHPFGELSTRAISFDNVRVRVLLSYDGGLNVYTELYSTGASPKFSSMSGNCTVKGPSYQAPFSLRQSTTATRTISKYISTGKKFKSGSSVSARSIGTASGGNIIGGSGSFDITAKAKIP